MNPRTIRRAIERKAQKLAVKEAAKAVAPADVTIRPVTEMQLEANRRNAALSTGPVSIEGKARSSRNALKTGLTGKTVLLSTDDAALYEHHIETFFGELNPVGSREAELVQSIADSKWRLARIPSLEFGIYALGRIEFSEEFQNLPKAEAALLVEAKTFMAYQRQLNNLSIQESRLRRQAEKDTAELSRLQQSRAAAERAETATRKAVAPAAKPQTHEIGFEFATADLNTFEMQSGEPQMDVLSFPQAA